MPPTHTDEGLRAAEAIRAEHGTSRRHPRPVAARRAVVRAAPGERRCGRRRLPAQGPGHGSRRLRRRDPAHRQGRFGDRSAVVAVARRAALARPARRPDGARARSPGPDGRGSIEPGHRRSRCRWPARPSRPTSPTSSRSSSCRPPRTITVGSSPSSPTFADPADRPLDCLGCARSPAPPCHREAHLRADPDRRPGQTPRTTGGLAPLEGDLPAPTVDLHLPRWRGRPAVHDSRDLSGRQETMKAVIQQRYGGAEVLQLRDVERPSIGPDEVLVRIQAASIHVGDWVVMTGTPFVMRFATGLRAPKNQVPGTDVAGIVEAVGGEVATLRPGDEVFGWGAGAFAEYVRAPEASVHQEARHAVVRGGGRRRRLGVDRPPAAARRRKGPAGPEGPDQRRVRGASARSPFRSRRPLAPR